MSATHEILCPVCGTLPAFAIDCRKVPRGLHRTVLCPSCGMAWSSPRPSEKAYLDFYRDAYTEEVYGLDGSDESFASVIEWRCRRSRQKAGYFPTFWKRGQRVLEIGAGLGAFLDVLAKDHGAKAWGIEPSPAFVSFAKRAFDLKLFHGSYQEWRKRRPSAFPATFDRIVMDQILEHMLEPALFLTSLHALLAKGGQLFISVPSVAAPKEPKEQFFIFEHVSYFSPFALCALLLRAGFKPTGLFAESPGSLQVTAAPFSSEVAMLDPRVWGSPLTKRDIDERFSRL